MLFCMDSSDRKHVSSSQQRPWSVCGDPRGRIRYSSICIWNLDFPRTVEAEQTHKLKNSFSCRRAPKIGYDKKKKKNFSQGSFAFCGSWRLFNRNLKRAATCEKDTYVICKQRIFRRACANTQPLKNLRLRQRTVELDPVNGWTCVFEWSKAKYMLRILFCVTWLNNSMLSVLLSESTENFGWVSFFV